MLLLLLCGPHVVAGAPSSCNQVCWSSIWLHAAHRSSSAAGRCGGPTFTEDEAGAAAGYLLGCTLLKWLEFAGTQLMQCLWWLPELRCCWDRASHAHGHPARHTNYQHR